uniref:Cytochrome P450 monooxygenase CYP52X1 n=1 Tax=Ganoderma boninense TaxID=34458 RepID=A0A5K1K1W9_9APHY|nr:Cytochrome P450 monooxygenase CYP52X1 [Ganoderma boninense]
MNHHRFSSTRQMLVTISATGPQGTFHLATLPFCVPNDLMARAGWDSTYGTFLGSILNDSPCFSAVREVWISGVHPETHDHTQIAAAFTGAIAGLQALETIVLVEPPRGYSRATPTLCLCPDAHGSVPLPPNLRTLRLVYAHGAGWTRVGITNCLGVDRLLAELETGAYGYFETLVLEMRRWLDVSPEDIVRLRGHFATVECRYVDEPPTMPLPNYSMEPYGGPGGTSSLLGSLW